VTYKILRWLEFYGSYSGNHARFTRDFDDGTGHLGKYITDAPDATGAFALYVTNLGPWSGGLEYRYLGNYPLSSGPCIDSAAAKDFPATPNCASAPTAAGQVNGKGFGELNMDAHYAFSGGWGASLGRLQHPEYSRCCGGILVCRPPEVRDRGLSRRTGRYP
jgi:hypothetical protein